MTPSSKPAAEHAEEVRPELTEAPEWAHEECVQYEVARESITALMAYRSQWIFDERQKPAPDAAAIDRWRAERARYAGLIVLRARDRIARVCQDKMGVGLKCARAVMVCLFCARLLPKLSN